VVKKKEWYYQGKIKISKCDQEINYRSGWERDVALLFEHDTEIIKVEYETLRIPYISNKKTKRIKIYLPDFLIVFKNGNKKIIEIKRDDRVKTKIVIAKALAAKKYIENNLTNTDYEIWTKKDIEQYKTKLGVSLQKKVQFKKATATHKKKKIIRTNKPIQPRQELLLEMYKKCSKKKK
jgi:hypothetical protein